LMILSVWHAGRFDASAEPRSLMRCGDQIAATAILAR
jgi:hypothetical protein